MVILLSIFILIGRHCNNYYNNINSFSHFNCYIYYKRYIVKWLKLPNYKVINKEFDQLHLKNKMSWLIKLTQFNWSVFVVY